jgi:hypothetical protein
MHTVEDDLGLQSQVTSGYAKLVDASDLFGSEVADSDSLRSLTRLGLDEIATNFSKTIGKEWQSENPFNPESYAA